MGLIQVIRDFISPSKVTVTPPIAPDVSAPPARWSSVGFGPGQPIRPAVNQFDEPGPRAFDYVTGINATISPRIAYGLISFQQLKNYALSIPELGQCRRLLTAELSGFVPRLEDDDGQPVDLSELKWMTTKPDGRLSWDSWLARYLWNVIVYDAGTLSRIKENSRPELVTKFDYYCHATGKSEEAIIKNFSGGRTIGLRVIDGSTIFPVIDEYGEVPEVPFPAYVQVIKGMPYKWFTTDTLYYEPKNLRVDAPYGLTPIEDAIKPVEVLLNWWDWITSFYTEGNMPEQVYTPPDKPEWTYEKVLEFEEAYNALATGNKDVNGPRRIKFLPPGFSKAGDAKDFQFHEGDYKTAFDSVSLSHGIPPSEWGDAPGAGLGGKGFQEGGESAFFRMALEPLKAYVERPFNAVLEEMGYTGLRFALSTPDSTPDPEKEQEAALKLFAGGLARRDEARGKAGLDPLDDADGQVIVTPQGAQPGMEEGGMIPVTGGGMIPVTNGAIRVNNTVPVTNGLTVKQPVTVKDSVIVKAELPEYLKHCGVCEEDDALFGASVSRSIPMSFPKKSTNNLEIVAISDDVLGTRPAVWRPETGEAAKQRAWVGGPLYPREEAVYLLDRSMDLYIAPLCYVTEIDGVNGVVCHYVKGRNPAKDVADYSLEWVERAGILDYVSGQTDRISKNWLTHPDDPGRVILIDNSLSFCSIDRPLLSPFADHIRINGLSKDAQDRLYLCIGRTDVWADIAELVGQAEADAAKQRAVSLLEMQEARELATNP